MENLIAWEDMKEGMVVRCVECNGHFNYDAGKEYPVGTDEYGDFGPIDKDGHSTSKCYQDRYKFTLVSEPRKTIADAVSEAEAKRREGEKVEEWTHMTPAGNKCIIVSEKQDDLGFIPILAEWHGYALQKRENLKPIKPTITKDKMLDLIERTAKDSSCTDNALGNLTRGWLERYTITD